jgi:myo-inositol-1-phosphate synthase
MEQTKTYKKYKENSKNRFVRYSEGAEMYHISVSKFMQMAKDAKACYKLGQAVLVSLELFDKYLETFHIVDDDFYK